MADRCRSCRAEIVWAVSSRTGKRMPVEPAPEGRGNVELTYVDNGPPIASAAGAGAGTHLNHFATCPHADDWRRDRQPTLDLEQGAADG